MNKKLEDKLESLSPGDDEKVRIELFKYFIDASESKLKKMNTLDLVQRFLTEKQQRMLLNFIHVLGSSGFGGPAPTTPQVKADIQYNGAYEE